ncbi:hypothetical protein CPB84DRAFT_1774170, partial [Gymnopilus junonius]
MKLGLFGFVAQQRATLSPVPKADLTGKTVLVTGANNGIGYEAVKHFARMQPARLILACRSKEKGQAALEKLKKETNYPGAVELWIVDLADFSSVKSFAERFEADGGRLDIFVANAAIDPNKKLNYTADGWESAVQYNTVPRLVVVSSLKSLIDSKNPWRKYGHKDEFKGSLTKGRYNETKLLNLFFTRALNDRLAGKPIVVTSVNPGYCYSSLRRRFTGLQSIVDSLMEKALAHTSEEGSRQLVFGAVGGGMGDNLRGAYINLSKVEEPSDYVLSTRGKAAQEKLWGNLVEELVKVDPKVEKIIDENLTTPMMDTMMNSSTGTKMDSKMGSKMDSMKESKMEPMMNSMKESKMDSMMDSMKELKMDSMTDSKMGAIKDMTMESKMGSAMDLMQDSKMMEPMKEMKMDSMMEPTKELKMDLMMEPKMDSMMSSMKENEDGLDEGGEDGFNGGNEAKDAMKDSMMDSMKDMKADSMTEMQMDSMEDTHMDSMKGYGFDEGHEDGFKGDDDGLKYGFDEEDEDGFKNETPTWALTCPLSWPECLIE